MQDFLEFRNTAIGRNQVLINPINSKIGQGELLILSGKNGYGKSTLLKTIAGIIPPIKGDILLGQKSIATIDRSQLSRRLSFAGTERIREDYITIEDMVRFGRYPYSEARFSDNAETAIASALQRMEITDIRHKYLNKISDGEWQKANIARALAQETSLILLDEPSAFLDYPSRIRLFQNLSSVCLTENKTVILSTHNIETANAYGTLFWHLENGILTESITPPVWEM